MTPDDFEREQARLEAEGVTDGLPVVPPTPGRIARMLEANGLDPEAVVALLPSSFEPASWRSLACNAVLAGCRPGYLPVIGAAVEAMAAPEFNLLGIQTTTGSAAPLAIVNGPVAAAIGMNAEANAFGPGNRANATIGRAIRLVLQNVGGAKPGSTDMATLGQPGKYTFCLAENDKASPWPALHVERGFAPADSVVTMVGAAGIVEVVDGTSQRAEHLVRTLAQSMLIAGSIGGAALLGGGEPLLVIPPELAALLHRDGLDKRALKAAVFEQAVLPLDRLSPAIAARVVESRKAAGDADPHAPVRTAEKADDVMIVVAGGVGIKAAYVPTWGGSTRAVSRRIPGASAPR